MYFSFYLGLWCNYVWLTFPFHFVLFSSLLSFYFCLISLFVLSLYSLFEVSKCHWALQNEPLWMDWVKDRREKRRVEERLRGESIGKKRTSCTETNFKHVAHCKTSYNPSYRRVIAPWITFSKTLLGIFTSHDDISSP